MAGSSLNSLRSLLYAAARLLGDANALARGKIIQRLARKALLRRSGGFIGRLFK